MNLIISIALVTIIYIIIKRIYIIFWNKNLHININFSEREAFEGDEIHIVETVTNKKLLPLPILMIKFNLTRCLRFSDTSSSLDDVDSTFDDGRNSTVTDMVYRNDIVSAGPFQKVERKLPIKCLSRGYCHVKTIYRISCDLFLNEKLIDQLPCNTSLYVYPRFLDASSFDISFKSLIGDIITKRNINPDPFEFRGIRDYQSFDSLKDVNWKASARSMDLKVNQTNATSSWQVTILLNLDCVSGLRDEELDENAIRLTATFAKKFIDLGIPISFATNAKDEFNGQTVFIPSGCGKNHIRTILMGLSRINVYKHKIDDFVSVINSATAQTGTNNWLLIISPVVNNNICSVLASYKDDMKYIVPARPDELPDISGPLEKCFLTWINNY